MGFSSLIPKTGGRRSIDNIVVARELLRIVREKEHRFPSFVALWSKKEGRDYSPKELPLCINMARKCKKNEKKHEKQPFELMLGRSQGGRSQGESEKTKNIQKSWKKTLLCTHCVRRTSRCSTTQGQTKAPSHHDVKYVFPVNILVSPAICSSIASEILHLREKPAHQGWVQFLDPVAFCVSLLLQKGIEELKKFCVSPASC